MIKLKNKIPIELRNPMALPNSEKETKKWQEANYSWWQSHPMRYDWKESICQEEFSTPFYREIDRRFFENTQEYLNSVTSLPFSEFINFASLGQKDILEIGVGNGSCAQLFATHAKSFIGIDLTDYAVKSTSARFALFNVGGKIFKMDAEQLQFPNNSFDFIWSWGVIHHSSNTKQILDEIYRVLRPGGSAVIMVYHRGWWNYYMMGILEGIVSGTLWKERSLVRAIQLHTDGAIARYYSVGDWKRLVGNLFSVEQIEIRGPKTDLIPLPGGQIKSLILRCIPNILNRYVTSRLRMGGFLISRIAKNKNAQL